MIEATTDVWRDIAGAIARREPVLITLLDAAGNAIATFDGCDLRSAYDAAFEWFWRDEIPGRVEITTYTVELLDSGRRFRPNRFTPCAMEQGDTLTLRVEWGQGEVGLVEESGEPT